MKTEIHGSCYVSTLFDLIHLDGLSFREESIIRQE